VRGREGGGVVGRSAGVGWYSKARTPTTVLHAVHDSCPRSDPSTCPSSARALMRRESPRCPPLWGREPALPVAHRLARRGLLVDLAQESHETTLRGRHGQGLIRSAHRPHRSRTGQDGMTGLQVRGLDGVGCMRQAAKLHRLHQFENHGQPDLAASHWFLKNEGQDSARDLLQHHES
jgi:hypothetical protein